MRAYTHIRNARIEFPWSRQGMSRLEAKECQGMPRNAKECQGMPRNAKECQGRNAIEFSWSRGMPKFHEGDAVEYLSVSLGRWIPAKAVPGVRKVRLGQSVVVFSFFLSHTVFYGCGSLRFLEAALLLCGFEVNPKKRKARLRRHFLGVRFQQESRTARAVFRLPRKGGYGSRDFRIFR